MAHEITKTDAVVLHREPAWHRLGVVVENAPTPTDALDIAGLNWSVEQWPIYAHSGESRLVLDGQYANVRVDTTESLGIVTNGYTPIQNSDLAEFCELLADQGDEVKIESAGSIRGGRKVWFLLKGESFSIRSGDDVTPYICVSNGHDGGTALRCTPTTVRVVCSNTLHMVIPNKFESESAPQVREACYVANHKGDVRQKVQDARNALGLYRSSLAETQRLINSAAARDMNSTDVERFLLDAYATIIEPIPVGNQRDRKYRKATNAIGQMIDIYSRESKVSGENAWTAFNAFSGFIQHSYGKQFRTAEKAYDHRVGSSLFGIAAERTHKALQMALSL